MLKIMYFENNQNKKILIKHKQEEKDYRTRFYY